MFEKIKELLAQDREMHEAHKDPEPGDLLPFVLGIVNEIRQALGYAEGKLAALPKAIIQDASHCVLARALSNGWDAYVGGGDITISHYTNRESVNMMKLIWQLHQMGFYITNINYSSTIWDDHELIKNDGSRFVRLILDKIKEDGSYDEDAVISDAEYNISISNRAKTIHVPVSEKYIDGVTIESPYAMQLFVHNYDSRNYPDLILSEDEIQVYLKNIERGAHKATAPHDELIPDPVEAGNAEL